MHRLRSSVSLALTFVALAGCGREAGTEPPPTGWANTAPTVVEQVVDRGDSQLLSVRQGPLRTWIQVPDVDATAGDYVLLGQGTPRYDVEIPELRTRASVVVDIGHVRVVDAETARQTLAAAAPADAVDVATLYAELGARVDKPIVVHGTVVKATSAVGSTWVHLQDGTGDAAAGTHDITVQTQASVTRGQRVSFRGTLREDVDLGFGYHYDALIESGELVD